MLDIDDSGGLSFRELELGLRKLKVFAVTPLPGHLVFLSISSVAVHIVTRTFDNHDQVNPPIRISQDDWDTMTLSGTMTNENCELDNPHFEIVMRRQLKLYVQRQLANAMEVIGSDNQVRLLLGCRARAIESSRCFPQHVSSSNNLRGTA